MTENTTSTSTAAENAMAENTTAIYEVPEMRRIRRNHFVRVGGVGIAAGICLEVIAS